MSTFLGPEQQSAFKTLSNWPWDISDSREEVNFHLPPLADQFVFVSRDDVEFPVLCDEPTIVVPRINHSQLPPETFELILEKIQQNAEALGVKFRNANQKLAAKKEADALLLAPQQTSKHAGRFVARSATDSPAPQVDGPKRGRPPKAGKGKATKPKPYGRVRPRSPFSLALHRLNLIPFDSFVSHPISDAFHVFTFTSSLPQSSIPAPPPPFLTPSEQTFRSSQHISPASFVLVRDKYLSYWSALLAYRKLFASEEEVPPVDPLPLIGKDGSTERKFRLAVGKYLVGEGLIPEYLVDGQRGETGLLGLKKGKGGRWGKGAGGFGKKKKVGGGLDATGGEESSTGTATSVTGGVGSEASTPMDFDLSVGGGYFPSATDSTTSLPPSSSSHLTPNSEQPPISACPPYLTNPYQQQAFTPTFDHLSLSSEPPSRASSSTSSSNDSARPHTPPESAAPTPSPSYYDQPSSSSYPTLASLAAVMNIPLPSAQV
ncbi:hypothetical protein BDY24DRAFT_25045 [Mrakia frigida]|uniref:uncharacterized protein n=1 Tax=Mrakia frigida TaxID=29902 RepID=UPI003FCC1A41